MKHIANKHSWPKICSSDGIGPVSSFLNRYRVRVGLINRSSNLLCSRFRFGLNFQKLESILSLISSFIVIILRWNISNCRTLFEPIFSLWVELSETKKILKGFELMAYMREKSDCCMRIRKWNFYFFFDFLLYSEKLRSEFFDIEFSFDTVRLVS